MMVQVLEAWDRSSVVRKKVSQGIVLRIKVGRPFLSLSQPTGMPGLLNQAPKPALSVDSMSHLANLKCPVLIRKENPRKFFMSHYQPTHMDRSAQQNLNAGFNQSH